MGASCASVGSHALLLGATCPTAQIRSQAYAVRASYPRWLTYTVYVNLELAIMGADLQDLLGTAQALRLLTGLPLYVGAIVSSVLSMLLLYAYEAQQRYMEIIIGVTILIVCFCLFVNTAHAQPEVPPRCPTPPDQHAQELTSLCLLAPAAGSLSPPSAGE